VPGTADDAAAATPEAAAAASSAATAAAAAASPAAAAAFPFAAELDAALAGPSSAELLASAGLSDWSSWLDFSLAPAERIPIDEALWPRVVAIERAVCNDPWRYQPRLPGSKRKYEFSGSSRKKRKNDEQAEELDEGDAAAEGGEGAAEASKTKRRRKLKVEAGAKEGGACACVHAKCATPHCCGCWWCDAGSDVSSLFLLSFRFVFSCHSRTPSGRRYSSSQDAQSFAQIVQRRVSGRTRRCSTELCSHLSGREHPVAGSDRASRVDRFFFSRC